ncbi:hypothetical protein BDAP_000609 [Binucleata daphniae]
MSAYNYSFNSSDKEFINQLDQTNEQEYDTEYTNPVYNEQKENVKMYNRKKIYEKPWMFYVDKYSLLSNQQKEALNMYFLSNQIKLSRKNLRHISKELKISYKKIINYVYERDYGHLILKEDENDYNIAELNMIRKELNHTWDMYLESSDYFIRCIKRYEE